MEEFCLSSDCTRDWPPRKANTLKAAGKSWRAQGGLLPRKANLSMSPSHDAFLPGPLPVTLTNIYLNALLQRWVVVGRGRDSIELRAAL